MAKATRVSPPVPKWSFCPLCSNSLMLADVGEGKQRLRCTSSGCNFVHWQNPITVAATLVPQGSGLVLVKRGVQPRLGYWAFPAGFEDAGESPQETAAREGWEEIHRRIKIARFLEHIALPNLNQVIAFFLAHPLATPRGLRGGSDVKSVDVFQPKQLRKLIANDQIAFSTHTLMIRKWLRGAFA